MNRVKTEAYYSFSYKDIDECERFSPCNQICTNTDGSFECSCNAGFQLQNAMQTCEGMYKNNVC